MNVDICLTTLNSTYQHTSFGLRYLYANLKSYQNRARIIEFTIHRPPLEIVDHLLSFDPRIIGFGVYIWNTSQTLRVISLLKSRRPDIVIVLGGPEVSYETEKQPICELADHIICGEADFLFHDFCHQILGAEERTSQKIIKGPLPDIQKLEAPYSYYDDNDIKNRIVYVEASRGCPYKCEYCLSSLDKSVRNFPIDSFLSDLQKLMDRGVRQFKFIDRTFNLSPSTSLKILRFFLDRIHLGLFLHFEMVPDRLPLELRELIQQFPSGSLQFEIGIQTWNPTVAALVSRRQDYQKVEENLRFLKENTGVHTHVDLIAGLPGETLQSFEQGFNRLAALCPDEIQVGILKRLKGTPIVRHDKEWQMVYSSEPPFQILQNKTLDAETISKIQKFSKFWDLIANSGNFQETMTWIRSQCANSLFEFFWGLTDFLSERHPQGHSIHLLSLFQSLLTYFEQELKLDMRPSLARDYQRGRPGPIPRFLKVHGLDENPKSISQETPSLHLPKRQQQHLRQ